MFLQKSKKFHSVLSFEANGLTLNYWFSSILSKLTPQIWSMYEYILFGSSGPNLEENRQSMDFLGFFKCQTTQLELQ